MYGGGWKGMGTVSSREAGADADALIVEPRERIVAHQGNARRHRGSTTTGSTAIRGFVGSDHRPLYARLRFR